MKAMNSSTTHSNYVQYEDVWFGSCRISHWNKVVYLSPLAILLDICSKLFKDKSDALPICTVYGS